MAMTIIVLHRLSDKMHAALERREASGAKGVD